MGSPDYPGEDEHTFQPPPSNELPMHGNDHSDEYYSDHSNNSGYADAGEIGDNDYAGYQPLNVDPYVAYHHSSDIDSDEEDENNLMVKMIVVPIISFFFSFHIRLLQVDAAAQSTKIETTAEREILSEIWNSPRPAELDIDLDTKKAEEVICYKLECIIFKLFNF